MNSSLEFESLDNILSLDAEDCRLFGTPPSHQAQSFTNLSVGIDFLSFLYFLSDSFSEELLVRALSQSFIYYSSFSFFRPRFDLYLDLGHYSIFSKLLIQIFRNRTPS